MKTQAGLSFVYAADACGGMEGDHHGKNGNLVLFRQIEGTSSEGAEFPAVGEQDSLGVYLYTGALFQGLSHL